MIQAVESIRDWCIKNLLKVLFVVLFVIAMVFTYAKYQETKAQVYEREAKVLEQRAKDEMQKSFELKATADELKIKAEELHLQVSESDEKIKRLTQQIANTGPVILHSPTDFVPLPTSTPIPVYDLVQTQAMAIIQLKTERATLLQQVSALEGSLAYSQRAYSLEVEAHGRTKLSLKAERQKGLMWKIGGIAVGIGIGYTGGRLH